MEYAATAQDFAKWENSAKGLDLSSLHYVIKDCLRAAKAQATIPGQNKENYYRDQGMTYHQELRKRQAKS